LSKRSHLIRKTLLLCSLPVLLGAAIIGIMQWTRDVPYVAGKEEEGITRSLDRSLEQSIAGLRFTEVSERAGIRFEHFPFRRTSQLPEDMGPGVAWGDYDGDGLPDLFLVNFAAPLGVPDEEMAASPATDRLYRNRGDGTSRNRCELWRLRRRRRRGPLRHVVGTQYLVGEPGRWDVPRCHHARRPGCRGILDRRLLGGLRSRRRLGSLCVRVRELHPRGARRCFHAVGRRGESLHHQSFFVYTPTESLLRQSGGRHLRGACRRRRRSGRDGSQPGRRVGGLRW